MSARARLAVDIGGTFTDLALELDGRRVSAKVLTTTRAPEDGVLSGIAGILAKAGIQAQDIGVLIHGTTLATNAIIERKGAKTALIVTEGFRDSVEMAFENRFEQYDIFMDKPPPLVPQTIVWKPQKILVRKARVVRCRRHCVLRVHDWILPPSTRVTPASAVPRWIRRESPVPDAHAAETASLPEVRHGKGSNRDKIRHA